MVKLYKLVLGCKPQGRNTEQHDVFFGIGNSLKDLLPQIEAFWPDAGKIHIDSWRTVCVVDDFEITVIPKNSATTTTKKLFFLNLGGYKPDDLEEYHYKFLAVANDKAEAINKAKKSAFFLHNNSTHVDDKYGVDVDDIYEIEDILPPAVKQNFTLHIKLNSNLPEDKLNVGYLKLTSL